MLLECHFHAILFETGCLRPGFDLDGQLSEFLYGSITDSIGKNDAKSIQDPEDPVHSRDNPEFA
jgi:hypothetical protein